MSKLLSAALFFTLVLAGCGSKTKESLFEQGVQQLQASNPGGAVVYFKNALEKDANFTDARFQLAKAYAALGRFEQAEREFTKVRSQNPSRGEVTLELAKLYIATGKGDLAFKLAEGFLATHPGNIEALETLGNSCAMNRNYEDAESYLLQALNRDPLRVQTKLELAALNIDAGRDANARSFLAQVLESAPKNIRALYLLAALEKKSAENDKAVALYQKILSISPKEILALYKLGLIRIEKDQLDLADANADALIKKFPGNGDGYRLKGLVGFYHKQYNEAIDSLQRSLKIAPTLEGYYFLGLCFYNQGLLESAMNEFRAILNRVPNSRQARLMVGQILLTQNRVDDAIREIKKVVAANDADALAHNLLGSAYLTQGLFEEGMRELNKATSLDPKMVTAHLKKGYYYFVNGKNAEGETELVTAVQAAPNVLNNRLLLAAYYQRQGKGTKALALLRSGLTGEKSDAQLYNSIASLNFSANDPAEGIKNLQKAKNLDPALAASYLNLAGYYASKGDYPKAMEQHAALLKTDAKNGQALLGLATLYEASGRDADALAQYQRATKEKVPEAFLAQANFHRKKGEPDKAIKVLDEALKLKPRAMAPLEMKGRLLVEAKKYREALRVFDEQERVNQDAGVANKIGACLAMQEVSKAQEQARRLISRRPDSAFGYLMLASVYESQKDLTNAISEVRNGIRAEGKSAEARICLGRLFELSGELDKALNAYRDALRMKPDSATALFAMGALLDRTGNKREAIDKYRAILKKSEGFVPALNNLAYLCADGYGDKGEALLLATAASRKEPGNAGVMDTLGYALLKNGRNAEALQVLERAAGQLPNDATVRYHLALAYKQAGDRPKAQQALNKSLELGAGPDARAVRALSAELRR